MKIEEYSQSVIKKAEELLKNGQVKLVYPMTQEQIKSAKEFNKNWHFTVKYGEDKKKKNGEYYVDMDGNKGNLVLFNADKDMWICTCRHYIASGGSENCKHILAARLLKDKIEGDES